MRYVFAAMVLAVPLLLAIGSLTGRVKIRSCCSVGPERDLRIINALREDEAAAARPHLLDYH